MIPKPGNKIGAPSWPDPYASVNWVIIVSGNGLCLVKYQAIIWTNDILYSQVDPKQQTPV